MASEYAHCYGGDASREYLSVEDATSNGGDASREYFSGEDATTNGGDASREYFSVENATTNGGDASRVGKRCSYYLVDLSLTRRETRRSKFAAVKRRSR